MTRRQRRFHAALWIVLGPALLAGFVALVWSGPTLPAAPSTPPATGAVP